jgi:hypothetical protein
LAGYLRYHPPQFKFFALLSVFPTGFAVYWALVIQEKLIAIINVFIITMVYEMGKKIIALHFVP